MPIDAYASHTLRGVSATVRSQRVTTPRTRAGVVRRTALAIFIAIFPATFLVAAATLTGCATGALHMMPTPVVFKDERLDFTSRLPAGLRATRVPVFYAAVRAGDSKEQPMQTISFGVAQVRLGEPQWDWPTLIASDRESNVAQPR